MSGCRAEPTNFSTELDHLPNTFYKHVISIFLLFERLLPLIICLELCCSVIKSSEEAEGRTWCYLFVGIINSSGFTALPTLKFQEFMYTHTALGLVGLIPCHASTGTVEGLRVLALKD